MAQVQLNLKGCQETKGRALFIDNNDKLYVSRGYSIFRSEDAGRTWALDCRIPAQGWKPLASRFELGARLLRYNIEAMQVLPDGTRVAVARDGIYRAGARELEMSRSWRVTRGSRPINLSVDGNRVLFGEYGGLDMVGVRVYCSDDSALHFEPVYEFPIGDIHHLHNIVVDRYANHYWLLAGDHGRTPGIGTLSKDFKHLEWVERGNQMVRAVSVLVRPDCLIYGSDSELEVNYIIRLDKKTGQYERLMPTDGTSLYAAQFGEIGIISTCVEPSKVNKGKHASLYGSMDDVNWSQLMSFRKDHWNCIAFQFGLIVLPNVEGGKPGHGMFSGQALKKHHDRTSIFAL
ncbi:MAG: hypothetical protein ABR907_16255 [Terracidiphilus sp.]